MTRRRINRAPVRAHPREVANLGQCVEVVDANVASRTGSSNIQIAPVWVGGNVVESAFPSDQLNLEDLVRCAVLCMNRTREW